MLIRLVLTETKPFKNVKINKEIYGHPDAVFGQRPDGHNFFVNFDNIITVFDLLRLCSLSLNWEKSQGHYLTLRDFYFTFPPQNVDFPKR